MSRTNTTTLVKFYNSSYWDFSQQYKIMKSVHHLPFVSKRGFVMPFR